MIKPKSQPQTLGSGLSKPSPVIAAKPYDAFASIAASGPSRALHAGSDSNVSGRPGRSTPSARPSVSPNLASNPQDAFSGLLSLGVTSNSNVSIAERQAQVERERIEKETRKAKELRPQSDFWDRYDSTASPVPATTRVAGSSSSQAGPSSSLFPSITLTPLSRPSSAVPSSNSHTSALADNNNVNDAWGDLDLLSLTNAPAPVHAPTLVPPAMAVATQDPFDFSEFGGTIANHTPSFSSSRSRSRIGDSDFGHERSGGLLGDDDSGGEDLLGGFGRPQVGLRPDYLLSHTTHHPSMGSQLHSRSMAPSRVLGVPLLRHTLSVKLSKWASCHRRHGLLSRRLDQVLMFRRPWNLFSMNHEVLPNVQVGHHRRGVGPQRKKR